MQLKQGTLLQGGKYRIEKVLGQGSFGITYLAKMKSVISGDKGHTSMWVDVAIKEFFMKDFNSRQPDGSLNETTSGTIVEKYKKDFKKEADNLAKMEHPGIVDILDTFEENNTCYLVMAYIDGESLDACISRNGAIPEKEALMYFEQIADALHYMHSQHMLHLDLKPRNIMLDAERNSFVIDFGLSKQYDENDEPESSTTLGQGTQGYAPLEQGAPHSGHDFPVTIDVYALGATLYKMLTTQTPPHAAVVLSSPEVLKNALSAKGISKSTTSYILKAMSPRKEDRYNSVAVLMKAFGWKVNDYPQKVILAEVVEYPAEDNTILDYVQGDEKYNIESEVPKQNREVAKSKIIIPALLGLIFILGIISAIRDCKGKTDTNLDDEDTVYVDTVDTFLETDVDPLDGFVGVSSELQENVPSSKANEFNVAKNTSSTTAVVPESSPAHKPKESGQREDENKQTWKGLPDKNHGQNDERKKSITTYKYQVQIDEIDNLYAKIHNNQDIQKELGQLIQDLENNQKEVQEALQQLKLARKYSPVSASKTKEYLWQARLHLKKITK